VARIITNSGEELWIGLCYEYGACHVSWQPTSAISPEWYEFDSDGLNRLVEALYRRRPIIRDLITQFRNSCRNPFPSWTTS